MASGKHKLVFADSELIESIGTLPLAKEVEHCGVRVSVEPFVSHASCPECGVRTKLRSFSASYEVEDVFDAVFLWMSKPGAIEVVKRRLQELEEAEPEE